mgnify:CR=1 FL=1
MYVYSIIVPSMFVLQEKNLLRKEKKWKSQKNGKWNVNNKDKYTTNKHQF